MAYRDSTLTKPAASLSPVATWPSGAAQGDYAVAIYAEEVVGAGGIAPPPGWTQRGTASLTADGMEIRLYDLDGGVGASPPSTTFSANTSGTDKIIIIVVLSGRDVAAPRTFVQPTTNDAANTNPISAALAGGTAVAGDDLVSFLVLDKFSNADVWGTDWTGTGLTERQDDNNGWVCATAATQAAVAAGATGTITPTATRSSGSSNSGYWGVVLAIKAAAAPTITTQPQSQTKLPGETATFLVAATPSGGALIYQWKANGVNVGTNSASYTTGTLTAADNGTQITCDVTDSNGTTTSATAILTVFAPPVTAIAAPVISRF